MKQTLRNLLAEGKTKQVIDKLRQYNIADADLNAEVVQLSARFAQYERKQRMGLEDSSVLDRELNKINNALLSVIDRLEVTTSQTSEQVTSSHPPTAATPKPNWLKIGGWAVTAIAVIAGIVQIFGYSIKDLFSNNQNGKLTNITVYVEDKKHDLILKQQGQVIMDVEGGEAKKEDIDSKGTASFKNAKIGDKVHLKVDFSEPYRPVNPDSVYTIPADGRINLTVGLQNLNRVFGSVIWRDQPLAGVLVAIGELRDTTDATGSYAIPIPESAQRKEQEVKFLKSGFKMLIKKAFPQTNEPLNIVMEK